MAFLDTLIYGIREVFIAGVAKQRRSKINFVSGATAVDNPTTGATDITITGGGGGGGFTPPTGSGLVTVTSDTLDVASKPVAAGFYTFAGTPSSASLAALVTDETGSGALVFNTSPAFSISWRLANGAGTPAYFSFLPSLIAADRSITLPLLGANDTLVCEAFAQTLTNKTISGASNTITVRIANDVSGLAAGIAAFLATASGANLASALTTALPDSKGGTGLTALAAGIATFLGTPTGANLAAALTTALPESKGGTGLTALGTLVGAFLATPSGANLAAALTSALPVSKGGTNRTALGTSLQVLRTNTGATDTEWATISAAAAGSTANEIQTTDGAGALQAASNVKAGTTYLSIGNSPSPGAPAASGNIRLMNASTICVRNFANSADLTVAKTDASDQLFLGNAGFSSIFAYLYAHASTGIFLGIGANSTIRINSGTTQSLNPILGYSSPYSVHGTVISSMTDAAYTVPSTEYQYSQVEVPAALTLTANRAFKLPTPATEAASYCIDVSNLTTGGFGLVVGRADGAGTTYTLANGVRARFRIRPAGATLVSTTIT